MRYSRREQWAIVQQIVKHHLEIWNRRLPLESRRVGISSHLVQDFIEEIDRFAPLLKHWTFAGEHEWRLLSPLASSHHRLPEKIYMPTDTGLRVFLPFRLLTEDKPSMSNHSSDSFGSGFRVVIGPNVDPNGMAKAVRSLIPPEFGWLYNIPRTATPYR